MRESLWYSFPVDEEQFLKLHADGLPDMDIAEALFGNREKTNGQRVSRLRKRYGLSPNKAKRGPKTDTSLDNEIVRLYRDEGMTCAQIAERVKRGEPFIYDRLKKLAVPIDKRRGRYGLSSSPPSDLEQVWKSSFQEKVLQDRGIIVQGSAHRVAAHYGVSPQVATNWLKGAGLLRDRLPNLEDWRSLYETTGLSCDAIAKQVGVTPGTVSKHLKRQGVDVKNGYSAQEREVLAFVASLGVEVVDNDRTVLGGKELDIYCPEQRVAIEYNGTYWHSHPMLMKKGLTNKEARNYHLDKTLGCEAAGVRLIHVWEHMWTDPKKRPIYENMIRHALGKTENRIGARQTRVEKRPARTMRPFFEENNIQGYRMAQWAYVLVDKRTGQDLMSYTTGHAYFGKGIYDLEIARGACRLGWSVGGGATKLWKAIIEDNPEVNSIVYYVDLNHYNGSSVSGLPGAEFVKTQSGFWNWHVADQQMKNREPQRHAEITAGYCDGSILAVYNAGTAVYLWKRDPLPLNR